MVTPDLLDREVVLRESVPKESVVSEKVIEEGRVKLEEGTIVVEQNQQKLMAISQRDHTVENISPKPTLASSVRESVERYMAEMDDQEISNLYDMVLSEVEAPLLESVLKATSDNQSKTALILGLNRGTLRKKLRKYGML